MTGMSDLTIEVEKTDHVSFIVESIKDSCEFYVDKFGFKKEGVVESEETGDKYCALIKEGISPFVELVEVSKKSPLVKGGIADLGLNHLAFQVDDIESTLQKIREIKGKPIPEEPIVLGDIKFAYAKLRDESIIEVMEIPEDSEYSYQA